MMLIIAVLLHVFTLAGYSVHAVAEPLPASEDQEIDTSFGASGSSGLIDAIMEMAPVRPKQEAMETALETPTPWASLGSDEDWSTEPSSGVAYPVTGNLSVGVLYQVEEIEDLTADLIEMGTAGIDYTSHKVLVRAHWSFDFADGLF